MPGDISPLSNTMTDGYSECLALVPHRQNVEVAKASNELGEQEKAENSHTVYPKGIVRSAAIILNSTQVSKLPMRARSKQNVERKCCVDNDTNDKDLRALNYMGPDQLTMVKVPARAIRKFNAPSRRSSQGNRWSVNAAERAANNA